MNRCRLGREEYDGHAYCFEHGGFALVVVGVLRCDRAPRHGGAS